MSKIFLVGDSHIGLGFPNNTDKWFRIHKDYFDNFLIPILESRVEPGDIVIHLGDLFDNRNVIPINLLNYGMDLVERISKIAPFHIIVGNHDLWSKSTSEINTIRPFRFIPNVFIYDKTTKIDFEGIKLLMMPYVDNKEKQIFDINNNKDCEYLLCHSDLNGCRMHLTSVAHKNMDKIDISEFSKFKRVYSGHIHITQHNNNFTFVGSNFQMDRNDIGDTKGIVVLYPHTGVDEFIENNHSPIFRKISVITEDDVLELDKFIGTKDYIDLSISNKLLISNRKIRRKIESLLETESFTSIDYIDDIINIETEEELVVNDKRIEEEMELSSHLDYDSYIRSYIERKSFNDEHFKEVLLLIYDEILRIKQLT